MSHRVAPQAESDLDVVWHYGARESGSIDIADRLIDSVTHRFLLLTQFPYLGRSREQEFGLNARSFPVGEYVILDAVDGKDVLILRVVHGRRDLDALFSR